MHKEIFRIFNELKEMKVEEETFFRLNDSLKLKMQIVNKSKKKAGIVWIDHLDDFGFQYRLSLPLKWVNDVQFQNIKWNNYNYHNFAMVIIQEFSRLSVDYECTCTNCSKRTNCGYEGISYNIGMKCWVEDHKFNNAWLLK